jgi:hypothetical protein
MDEGGKVCAIIDKEGQEMVADGVLIIAGAVDFGFKAMGISATLAASVARNCYRERVKASLMELFLNQHAEAKFLQ